MNFPRFWSAIWQVKKHCNVKTRKFFLLFYIVFALIFSDLQTVKQFSPRLRVNTFIFPRLSKAFQCFPRLSKAFQGFPRLSKAFQVFPRISDAGRGLTALFYISSFNDEVELAVTLTFYRKIWNFDNSVKNILLMPRKLHFNSDICVLIILKMCDVIWHFVHEKI